MSTFLLTSPATNMSTGRHGALLLTDGGSPGLAGSGAPALILTGDPEHIGLADAVADEGVRLAEVECLEITLYVPDDPVWDWADGASAVILHLRDGSTASYRISGSSPVLLREIFTEAGWSRPCMSA